MNTRTVPAVAWLIERANGSKEVVLSPLTDDHCMMEGDEATPLYAAAPPQPEPLYIIFDGPPSHESGRFVEVETADGKSVRAGEWSPQGDTIYWKLGPFYADPRPEHTCDCAASRVLHEKTCASLSPTNAAATPCSAVRAVKGGTNEPSIYRWCSPCGKLLTDDEQCFKAAATQVKTGAPTPSTSESPNAASAAAPNARTILDNLPHINDAAAIEILEELAGQSAPAPERRVAQRRQGAGRRTEEFDRRQKELRDKIMRVVLPDAPSTLPLSADVAQLHRMINCSIFGWPDGEIQNAHHLLSNIHNAAITLKEQLAEKDREIANEKARSRTLTNAAIIATERAEKTEAELATAKADLGAMRAAFISCSTDEENRLRAELAELKARKS